MIDERMKVLIVGAGSIGERHVRCFQSTRRAEVSLCEVNDRLRTDVAQRYVLRQSYSTLDAALNDRHDAVVVATPAHLHVPLALQAARAGLHLFIEKPLATSLGGVEELLRTVRERNLVAAVAYVMRAHPSLATMKSAIDSGRFGRPLELVAVSGQHFPTYRPAYREIYYRDRATGGGAIQDALTHVINAGEYLAGPIDRLIADAEHLALEGVEVEDTVHVLARHGRLLASYSLNQHQAPNESTITVVCERGTVRFEYHANRWRWIAEPGSVWRDEDGATLERDTLFTLQANSFLDAVLGRKSPLCSLEEGMATLAANLAILESATTNMWTHPSAQPNKLESRSDSAPRSRFGLS